MGPWFCMAQQQKCNCSQFTEAVLRRPQHHPVRGTYNLTPASSTETRGRAEEELQAHTQHKAACNQAVAQYPISLNFHKETPWKPPDGSCHSTKAPSKDAPNAWDQAKQHRERVKVTRRDCHRSSRNPIYRSMGPLLESFNSPWLSMPQMLESFK